ncbi:uncharacterized protein JCM6883_001349 [Sporobolomyces salmoneus]|uniref:uncharacterized protein n=1 Tax=Sporobolomyces salmoneus TaxID=183962 RepID=UPI00316E9E0B
MMEWEEEEPVDWTPARQVLQIDIRSDWADCVLAGAPSRLLRFFPSASITSIDIEVHENDPPLPLSDVPRHQLLSLALRTDTHLSSIKPIDHFLPKFSNLRRLHLDLWFASQSFQTHILSLVNLVHLSLAYYDSDPNLDQLFSGLQSLSRLRTLELTYLRIWRGPAVDFRAVEEELINPRGGDLNPLYLLRDGDFRELDNWHLPWEDTISDTIQEVIELEEKARATGLVVKSNLSELVMVLRLKVIEFYNREVGNTYFYGEKDLLPDALALAEKHGLDVNRLEIDIDEDFDTEDLVWFSEEVQVGGTGKGRTESCYIYGLRFKTEAEYRESRNEAEASEDSARESEVD